MAQDDYQYEIQLSNKQLVFYFMAGATALILSFLAGVMVGKGVTTDLNQTQVVSEIPVVAVDEEPMAEESSPTPSYSYPQRLESNRVADRLEPTPTASRSAARATPTPTPRPATPAPPPPTPRVTPAPTAAPSAAAASTPRPATPGGRVSLQVGAFKDRAAADSLKDSLSKKGYPVTVSSPPGRDDFLVRVGPYGSRGEADQVKKRLLAQEKLSSFAVTQ